MAVFSHRKVLLPLIIETNNCFLLHFFKPDSAASDISLIDLGQRNFLGIFEQLISKVQQIPTM